MIRFLILSVMMLLVAFYSLTRMAWNVMSKAYSGKTIKALTRISFRVRLSPVFLRLPQIETLLAG